ncbi:unnamed protein product [Orchesella dallaii]|uniref:Uncharacterized protein n=1 Tax=Orchesella dallaii TaxID=48710 RepID=A0ABP1QUD4_9HEXA
MVGYLYILCALISTNTFITSTSAMDEAAEFDSFKNRICLLNPPFRGDVEFGYRWRNEMDSDEVLELAFVNMAYGLSTDAIAFRHEELGWRKDVIDILTLITKATCTEDIVAEQFLNSAKSLFLHYIRKYDDYKRNTTLVETEEILKIKTDEWTEIMESLKMCATQVEPIAFDTDCDMAVSFVGTNGIVYPIIEEMEQFDLMTSSSQIDWVIETAWWMFSTTYARCYSYFYPNEDIILLFFQKFREDFLDSFATRWMSVGANGVHFPLIFGPYDSTTSAMNTRKCAAAAFSYEGLGDRQLVRPVSVTHDGVQIRNFKIITADS